MTSRRLIVNADDFGLSAGVNQGVIAGLERGIVTSASLMVRQEAVQEAAAYCRSTPRLSVGLHLDLAEWVFEDDEWHAVYAWVDTDDAEAVEREVTSQFEEFVRLLDRPPSHVDSHQHVHRRDPARTVIRQLAKCYGLILRHESSTMRYCGDFYGQTERGEPLPERITEESLASIIASLPRGSTELCCHPAARIDFDAPYAAERITELRALCSDRVRAAIEDSKVDLVSFNELES